MIATSGETTERRCRQILRVDSPSLRMRAPCKLTMTIGYRNKYGSRRQDGVRDLPPQRASVRRQQQLSLVARDARSGNEGSLLDRLHVLRPTASEKAASRHSGKPEDAMSSVRGTVRRIHRAHRDAVRNGAKPPIFSSGKRKRTRSQGLTVVRLQHRIRAQDEPNRLRRQSVS